MVSNFDSIGDYFRFAFAKSFYPRQGGSEEFIYTKNSLEKIGGGTTLGVSSVADFMLRHIRNPLMILALTISIVAIVTIAFYPTVILSTLTTLLPFMTIIQPWMIKAAVFVFIQANIIGIALRTLGRLTNVNLMGRWNDRELQPIVIGTEVIREKKNSL